MLTDHTYSNTMDLGYSGILDQISTFPGQGTIVLESDLTFPEQDHRENNNYSRNLCIEDERTRRICCFVISIIIAELIMSVFLLFIVFLFLIR